MPIPPQVGAALIGLGGTGVQAGMQAIGGKKGHEREKELMDIQYQNQQNLNQQGHELQKSMWDYTNYGNQMKHIKEAGLNPGLMYGMSGGGGTTAGSQSGGSAGGGSYKHAPYMDMSALMMGAQIQNLKANTDKTDAEADNIKEQTENEAGGVRDQLSANVANLEAKTELMQAQKQLTDVLKNKTDKEIKEIDEKINELKQKIISLETQNKIDKATADDKIKIVNYQVTEAGLNNMLKRSQITLTNKEVTALVRRVQMENERLGIEKRKYKLESDKFNWDKKVEKFANELKAEYPSLVNVSGKLFNQFMSFVAYMTGNSGLPQGQQIPE